MEGKGEKGKEEGGGGKEMMGWMDRVDGWWLHTMVYYTLEEVVGKRGGLEDVVRKRAYGVCVSLLQSRALKKSTCEVSKSQNFWRVQRETVE